jgi:hypothetical protein
VIDGTANPHNNYNRPLGLVDIGKILEPKIEGETN